MRNSPVPPLLRAREAGPGGTGVSLALSTDRPGETTFREALRCGGDQVAFRLVPQRNAACAGALFGAAGIRQ
ncbi:hypothetical protein ACFY78_38910 [Streptomyces olindensis]|uniref:hypothetical protein n=1 Tax=Streptomyces olindensis TaxID=358823 RepID=UPI003409BEF4